MHVKSEFKYDTITICRDDTAIFNNDYTLSKIQINLQSDFDLLVRWLEINCMYIHPDKTKVIAFGPKRKLRNNVLYVKYNHVGLVRASKLHKIFRRYH